MVPSTIEEFAAELKAVGVTHDPRRNKLDFTPSPARRFAYTRDAFYHICDTGIWRPDDQVSRQCEKWLTEGGGRMLLWLDGPWAAMEVSQGAFMFRGLSLLWGPVGNTEGWDVGIVNKDFDWWEGFFFACIHFGLDAWVVNLDSGRVARATDSTQLCLSHFADDAVTAAMEEFFEYDTDGGWAS